MRLIADADPGSTPPARIESTADVASDATLGDGTTVWHLAQIRGGAQLGRHCVVGRGAYVGAGVKIGDACKLQNYALVYEPAVLAGGVFVGPAAVLTNDQYPRAVLPDGSPKRAADWVPVGVKVGRGASIGARAVCIAPLTIGEWALVAAGAVVVDDVADHALVVGTPARQIGWVGRAGRRLEQISDGQWLCPNTGEMYQESDGALTLIETPGPPPPLRQSGETGG